MIGKTNSAIGSGGGGGELHGATITGSVLNGLGATVELSLDGTVFESVVIDESGAYAFVVQNNGTYTITATLAEDVKTASVVVTSDNVVHKDMVTVIVIDFQEQIINYTMLYDEGNECVDVTGGWKSYAYSSTNGDGWTLKAPTITKNTDSMYITQSYSGTWAYSYSGSVWTEKMLDVTGYKKAILIGKGACANSATSWSGSWLKVASVKAQSPVYDASGTILNSNGGVFDFDGFVNVDLSSVSGNKYLAIDLRTSNEISNDTTLTVNDIFLVKEDIWQAWIDKAGLSISDYASLDAVMADAEALNTLMNNAKAVSFMLLNCTGTVIASVIQSGNALSAIRDSQYNAEIFANEHWCKFLEMVGETAESNKLYLYNAGDECVSVTGGVVLQSKIGTTSSVRQIVWAKNASNIYGYSATTSTSYGALGGVYFANPLPFDSYRKLCVDMSFEETNTSNGGGEVCVRWFSDTSKIPTGDKTSIVEIISETMSRKTVSVDLTSITTDDYMAITIGANANASVNGYVYRIWLE